MLTCRWQRHFPVTAPPPIAPDSPMIRTGRVLLALTLLMTATATVGGTASAQVSTSQGSTSQGSRSLPTGTRVRVTTLHGALGKDVAARRYTGTTEPAPGDEFAVHVRRGDSTVVLPASAVAHVEVSVGKRRRPWRGLALGAMISGGAGALIGMLIPANANDMIVDSRGEQALALGAMLGTLGGAAGLAAGSLLKSEEWRPVSPEERRIGVGLAPTRAGLALTARLTF